MDKIKIEIDEQQYQTLIDLLFIADNLLGEGAISKFKNDNERTKAGELLGYIYSFGKEFNISTSVWLYSVANSVGIPISEEYGSALRADIGTAFEDATWNILASKFAVKGNDFLQNDKNWETEGAWMTRREIITDRTLPYLKEFKENGIANLRFKFFKNPKYFEDEE